MYVLYPDFVLELLPLSLLLVFVDATAITAVADSCYGRRDGEDATAINEKVGGGKDGDPTKGRGFAQMEKGPWGLFSQIGSGEKKIHMERKKRWENRLNVASHGPRFFSIKFRFIFVGQNIFSADFKISQQRHFSF